MAHRHEIIGQYHILDLPAKGARGSMYHAEDRSRQGMTVVIKLIEDAPLPDESERVLFYQAVERLKTLRHPFIVPVLDAGLRERIPYVVMPYLPGGSLAGRLSAAGARPLPVENALAILTHVGSALHYAHQQGITHSDLKPANVLFDAGGSALLADFSLPCSRPQKSQYGAATGDPFYMSPEQFRGISSPASDQYALGCIAYQLVSGRPPFAASDFIALGFKHMSEAPFPPSQLNILLPRAIERVILKAMAKQPGERFSDIAAFLSALGIDPRAFVQSSSGASPHVSAFQPAPEIAGGRFHDEEDAEDATVIKPLYNVRPKRPQRRSSKGPPVHRPTAHTGNAPADPLPRLVDAMGETARPPSFAGAHPPVSGGTVEQAAALAAADCPAPPHERDLSTIDTIRTNEVFDVPQAASPIPTQSAPPLPALSPAAPVASMTSRRKRSRVRMISALLAALIILGMAAYTLARLLPLTAAAPANVTIMITPTDPGLRASYTLTGTLHTPDASRLQVQARILTTTVRASLTLPATGAGIIPGQRAAGTLTFFNDAAAPQPFTAGEVFTGANGVQVTNDSGGVVPAGNPGNPQKWSYITVPARAVLPGAAGNIAIKNVSVWENNSHFVVENLKAFSGGKEPQSYTVVRLSDMYRVTDALMSSVNQQTAPALQSQMRPGEEAAGPEQCTRASSYSHHAGDAAGSISAALAAHCTLEVYDRQSALSLASHLLQRQVAGAQPPSLATHISAAVARVSMTGGGNLTIVVEAASSEFTAAQLRMLAKAVAGKTLSAATAYLSRQQGIKQARITLSGGDGQTLPQDAGRIIAAIQT